MSEKPAAAKGKPSRRAKSVPPADAPAPKPRTRAADADLARRHDRLPDEDARVEVLIDAMVKARDFDFTGFVFHKGFAGFDGVRFDGHADFSGAQFIGEAGFAGAAFLGGVSLDGAEFAGAADFSAVQAWGLQFTNCLAYRDVDFRDARLTGADFSDTQVEGALVLAAATVSSEALVRRVDVGSLDCSAAHVDRLSATGAAIRGAACFARLAATDHVELSEATIGTLDFSEAAVDGAVGLAAATVAGAADFRWARIDRGVDGRRLRAAGVDFHGAHLGALDLREAVLAGEAYFDQVKVADHAVFRETRFGGGAYFGSARISGAVDFHRAQFLGPVDLHGAAVPPVGDFEAVAIAPGRGESFCRFARGVLASMGLYRQAGTWRFQECRHAAVARRHARFLGGVRRLRRRGVSRGPALALAGTWAALAALPELVFARGVFGYAERPLRVLAAAAALVLGCWPLYVLAAGAMRHAGDPAATMGVWEALRHSLAVFATFGAADWRPAAGTPAAWLQTIQAVSSPLLMILFIVTLTRRWTRG
jgi:uncharacterized protein YjbI with pentapeptide repeats